MTQKEYKQNLLNQLYQGYDKSMPCHLGFTQRQNIVWGEGNPDAILMLVGEAPGKEEDLLGRPFVGRSGKLLDRALELVGINRKNIYITNVLKCRPPENRTPFGEEIKLCSSKYLHKQIKIIRPKIIVTLGTIASQALLDQPIKITKEHGEPFKKDSEIIIPIYHPAYVLRNKTVAQSWLEDFKKIKKLIDNYQTELTTQKIYKD